MKSLRDLLLNEEGAVTVDFVVLCSGVVLVAMLIAPILISPVSNLAEYIGNSVGEYGKMLPSH